MIGSMKELGTALVTGANRGIGLETARELARRGFRVILTSRDQAKGSSAARAVAEETAGRVEFRRLDVADESGIRAFADAIRSEGIAIDLLVNNAAVALDGFDHQVARRTMDTNFYGPMRLTDALSGSIPDGGTIVMVSSSAGEVSILSPQLRRSFLDTDLTKDSLIALVEQFVESVRNGRHTEDGWPTSAYGVSKAALNALVRVTAPQLFRRRIRLNAVCPGWVKTDMGGAGAPRTVAQGAASVLWAALLSGTVSGGFFRDGKPIDW